MTRPSRPRPKLSIADAWDEANAFLRAERALIAPVALALVALPSAVTILLVPTKVTHTPSDLLSLLQPVAIAVQLLGLMTIALLAIGTRMSVGEALRAAARRLPVAFGAVALVFVPLLVALAPLFPYVPLDGTIPPDPPPLVTLWALAVLAAIAALGPRLALVLFGVVSAIEPGGPIAVLRRALRLTRGIYWKLFGFLLLFGGFYLIVRGAAELGIGAIVIGLARLAGAPVAGAAILALLIGTLAATLGTWLTVILARIYVQLAGVNNGT